MSDSIYWLAPPKVVTVKPFRGVLSYLLQRYLVARAGSGLAGIRAVGVDHLSSWQQGAHGDRPIVLLANHSSWWDAILPVVLSLHHLGIDAIGVMEEEQLRKFAFFRRLGFVGLDRDHPRSAIGTLQSLPNRMRGRTALWYFPQGKIVPVDRRPLHLERGTSLLLRHLDEPLVAAVAIRYETLRQERPVAYLRVGEPFDPASSDSEELQQILTQALENEMNQLRDDYLQNECHHYPEIFSGRESISSRWERMRSRFLNDSR